MILYHGSKNIIESPKYGYGKTYNDYGLGFYCTQSKEMAMEWAVGINHDGYANSYEINCDGLKILNLNDTKYCILHWLAILIKNREFDTSSVLAIEAKEYILKTFLINYEAYDIIIGYRADDSYFSFAQDFLNGTISYRQLNNAMHLGNLGEQVVLKSRISFDRIKFSNYELAKAKDWYYKKQSRDLNARKDYFNFEKNKREKNDLFITKILDEEMMEDDPRLR